MATNATDAGRRLSPEGMPDLLSIVNSSRGLDDILDYLVARAHAVLGSDGVGLYLRDPDDAQMLRIKAAHGVPIEVQNVSCPVGWPIIGVAVAKRRTVVVSNFAAVLARPRAEHFDQQLEERGTYLEAMRPGPVTDSSAELRALNRRLAAMYATVVAVPLMVRDDTYGTLVLYYQAANAYGPDRADMSLGFAQHAALAIENARLRSEAERRLHEIERRHRVAQGMRDLLASVNSTRSLDEVLNLVLAQASDLLECDADSVFLLDPEGTEELALTVRASRGLVADIVPVRLAVGTAITGVAVERGQPVAVADLLEALPVRGLRMPDIEPRPGYLKMLRVGDPAPKHLPAAGLPRVRDIAGYYRAMLAVPLAVRGHTEGAITLYYRQPREFSQEDVGLALAFADQTALAIENARSHAETERRSRELEALYRADEALHRSLLLDDVLRALVDVARDVFEADKTSVHIWDSERKYLVMAASYGYDAETMSQPLVPGEDLLIADLSKPSVLAIDDFQDPDVTSSRTRELVRREGIRAWIGAPITVSGQVFGLFGVGYCRPRAPSADDKRLVLALAQRAALAIHNARLFEQAPLVATAEERQRLARELHDAVTQTLFSASLIAEAVPLIWERDQVEGRKRLDELRRLTRGALAEMRSLLLELRPAALLETPFAHLLRQLAEATASRTNLQVDVRAEDAEAPLPPEVQIALYRIAQETLSNTDKHAAASHAEIHLRRRAHGVGLHLSDNGRGFDPDSPRSGHLGLGIMHERARGIGARLRIDSRPGGGTRIHVRWRGGAS